MGIGGMGLRNNNYYHDNGNEEDEEEEQRGRRRRSSEPEIHVLRAANGRLEQETHLLQLANHRLEKELLNCREQLDVERQLVHSLRRKRGDELRALKEDAAKKFESAIRDLKTRLSMEQSQSLESQKLQLERTFRCELIKLVHQKDSQLHRLFTHSQRVKREADKKCVADRQHYQGTYQLHLGKLKQDFQKQLTRLLLELKTKERHIESLQKTVLCVSNRSLKYSHTASSSSSLNSSVAAADSTAADDFATTTLMMTTTSFASRGKQKQDQDSRPVSRNKSFRGNRKHPYNSSSTSTASSPGKRRYEPPTTVTTTDIRMKEMGEQPEQFFYHHTLYGGSALETLPEAESEEECSENEEISEIANPLVAGVTAGAGATTTTTTTTPSSSPCCSSSQASSDDNFCLSHATSLDMMLPPDGPPPPPPIICYDSSTADEHRHKIIDLETTIRQLRDELRECKDQNELLEFRLLEIEEIGENSSSSQSGCEAARKCGKSNRGVRGLLASNSDVALYHGTEVSSADVTNRGGGGDYDSSSSNNSHASVAESRSSCSDCSDSLSLQESGIFDSQSVNDFDNALMGGGSGAGYANSMSPKEDISRELAHLTAQIESLVIRFAEGGSNNNNNNGGCEGSSGDTTSASQTGNENGQTSRGAADSTSSLLPVGSAGSNGGFSSSSNMMTMLRGKTKKGQDLTTELKSCRQRIQEFERRLTQFADFNYANSLEDKVALLVQENQLLEEERCELEEAENDSRHQCQRLEEKMMQLRQKKAFLQRQLSSEKLFVEQLRMKIIQLQEREEDLSTQIIRVDALECRNFELEESCIEMKCSLQFVTHSLPILVLWYLWSILKRLESFHTSCSTTTTTSKKRVTTFPALPPQCPSSTSSNVLSASVTGGVFARKHKLMSNPNNGNNSGSNSSAEPTFKKLRGAESTRGDCQEGEALTNINNANNTNNLKPPIARRPTRPPPPLPPPRKPVVTTVETASEPCEEEWKQFINDLISVQYKEWQRVESALQKKIELLENGRKESQTIFNSEKGKIIQHYEGKLAEEQVTVLEHSQKILEERRHLQDKWDSLVNELEQFVVSFGSSHSNHSNNKNNLQQGSDAISALSRLGNNNKHANETHSAPSLNPTTIVKVTTDGPKALKSGGLIANRIRSLFPGEWKGDSPESPPIATSKLTTTADNHHILTIPISGCDGAVGRHDTTTTINTTACSKRNELVVRLEQAFQEELTRFERREKVLLDEIERLKGEMGKTLEIQERRRPSIAMVDASSNTESEMDENIMITRKENDDDHDNSQIVYLSEENNRLQMILSDQESALSKVKELEEENEKLSSELSTSLLLRRRLEEAHGAETVLRNRVEELEQSEINAKETVEQGLRRERKCLERVSQLREEIQFLRTKCCQLQDELDSKIYREDKYKNEIQILASRVKGLMIELEEKENLLENDSTASQAQISKLRSQLNDVHKQMADVECSNGMLREEVLYLERTLQEAMERASSLEKMVGSLTGELGQREGTIESLQKELEHWNGLSPLSSSSLSARTVQEESLVVASNDLDIFAQNEGGLFGVDRDIKRIASQIQSCSRESCKSSSKKLTELSEQLNTLTMMLGGGSPMDRVINGDSSAGTYPERLSRCESDECLSRGMGLNSITKDSQKMPKNDEDCPKSETENSEQSTVVVVENSEVTPLGEHDDRIDDRDALIMSLKSRLCQVEERQKTLRDSHLTECSWYNARCRQKNRLILVLSRRIAHLSATDSHGVFLETIVSEIRQLERERDLWPPTIYQIDSLTPPSSPSHHDLQDSQLNLNELDFSCETLCLFLNYERKRIMTLLESAFQDGDIESPLDGSQDLAQEMDQELEFKICRRIAEDALLVSWAIPDKYSRQKVEGYEISVNGNVFLRIRDSQRFKVVLFGLDLSQPLHLSLKCTGEAAAFPQSTLTYIA